MKRDFIAKCGIDASACVCIYETFSIELIQQCIIAVCIVIINVFCYPLFKCFFQWFNRKLNLGVKNEDIEKGAKDASEKIKDAVKEATKQHDEDGKK